MLVGGFQRNSLVDFPGIVASVIFLAGCNFHCPYCHNPSLVRGVGEKIPLDEILQYLSKAKKIIDGVCITGGEPTLHGDELCLLIEKIRSLGLNVKLDTNGSNPELLRELLNEKKVDYVAMDLKTSLDRYTELSRDVLIEKKVRTSLEILQNQKDISYEFRTTLDPRFVSQKELLQLASLLKKESKWYWQQFKNVNCLDERSALITTYHLDQIKEFQNEIGRGTLR